MHHGVVYIGVSAADITPATLGIMIIHSDISL